MHSSRYSLDLVLTVVTKSPVTMVLNYLFHCNFHMHVKTPQIAISLHRICKAKLFEQNEFVSQIIHKLTTCDELKLRKAIHETRFIILVYGNELSSRKLIIPTKKTEMCH